MSGDQNWFRSQLRRVANTIRRPVEVRLDDVQTHTTGIENHVRNLEAYTQGEISRLQDKIDGYDRYMPDLMAAGSLVRGGLRRLEQDHAALWTDLGGLKSELYGSPEQPGVLPQHWAEIGQIWQRLETIRTEILLEQRYAGGAQPGAVPDREVRVVDPERVERGVAEGARLNLGCGHIALPGYLNVDFRELPGVDVVAPLDELPFDAGTVAEIHSAHVLEHFPEAELRLKLLPYWFGLLRPGGRFGAVVPDGQAMIDGYASGEVTFADLRDVLYGGQEYEGDFHHTLFTTDTLTAMLEAAGFIEVTIEARGRRNGNCLEFQLSATKPG